MPRTLWQPPLPAADFTVVGLFGSADEAELAAKALSESDEVKLLAVAKLDRFVFAASREAGKGQPDAALRLMTQSGGTALLEHEAEEKRVVLWMTCAAPDETTAAEIAHAIGGYLNTPYYLNAAAPWESDTLSAEEQARARRVAQTMEIFYKASSQASQEIAREMIPEVTRPTYIVGQMFMSRKRRMQETQRFSRRMFERQRDLVRQIAAERGVTLDEETMQVMAEVQDAGVEIPSDGVKISTLTARHRPTRFSGVTGFPTADGRSIKFEFVMFHRIAFGLPAMLGYLEDAGCSDFTYSLHDFDDVRGN